LSRVDDDLVSDTRLILAPRGSTVPERFVPTAREIRGPRHFDRVEPMAGYTPLLTSGLVFWVDTADRDSAGFQLGSVEEVELADRNARQNPAANRLRQN
jgi:hypothetical protein